MRDYSKLTPIKEDVMHRLCEAYEIGHADGYNEGHQKGYDDRVAEEAFDEDMRTEDYIRGLNDAWEAAKVISLNAKDGGLPQAALYQIFDISVAYDIFKHYTVTEVMDAIRKYETKLADEIKVGDEVKFMDNSVGVVTYVYEGMSDLKNSKKLDVIMTNGKCIMTESAYVEKTGRYFAIAGMLSQMKEGQ